MADAKITDLLELTTQADDDVLAIVDISAGPATTKKITTENLINNNTTVAANTAHRNTVTGNPHAVTQSEVGLGNVDNTSDVDKPVSTAQASADSAVQAYAIQRANHTGSQLASTISDFAASVRAVLLTGISFATATAVTASDSILIAIGKLQAQITAIQSGSKTIFSDYIVGTTSGPTTTATTSGTATVIDEMTKTFTPADAANKIDVFFSGTFGESFSNKDTTARIGIFIDGTLQPSTERAQTVKGSVPTDKLGSMSTQWIGSLTAASHTITVRFWRDDGGNSSVIQAIGVLRNLIIKEIDE